MRLSEAILAGSTLIKWTSGFVLTKQGEGCAIGMGLMAEGFTYDAYRAARLDIDGEDLEDTAWPWLIKIHGGLCAPCECAGHDDETTYWVVIAHLFDDHIMGNCSKWTLEQLVDYVRSIEPAEEPGCAEPAAPCTDAVSVGVK